MTTTATIYTLGSALVTAENAFLGGARPWSTKNALQMILTGKLPQLRKDLSKIPELESIAALNEGPINTFLRERSFNVQFNKFPELTPPERAWGAASVLDLLLEWQSAGRKTTLTTKEQVVYHAAHLSDGVSYFTTQNHSQVIASIATNSGDVAYMTMHDEKNLEDFGLFLVVEELSAFKKPRRSFPGLIFPMVDLDHIVDISWLKGMSATDDEGYYNVITQALQQTKLKMNHKGARVKDAVAIGGIRAVSMREVLSPLVIDKPFLFWIERPGLSYPLFVSRITEECWKDPGSLEM